MGRQQRWTSHLLMQSTGSRNNRLGVWMLHDPTNLVAGVCGGQVVRLYKRSRTRTDRKLTRLAFWGSGRLVGLAVYPCRALEEGH